jgi:cytochrome c1
LQTSGGSDLLAEFNRALRPGVQWRKTSFGTQSEEGSRFVESMMTVVATLKQQQRNVVEYLTAAHEAALRDEAVSGDLKLY